MTDTIGKCECINSSDKSEIDQVITDAIDELGAIIDKRIRSSEEFIEFGANPDELIRMYDSKKSKLKNLLVRVRNTPGCK